jgi:minor fimbrial subunit
VGDKVGINMRFFVNKFKIRQSQVYGSVLLFFISNIITTSAQAGWWREELQTVLDASFGNIELKKGQNVAGSLFPATASADTNNQRFDTKCDQGTDIGTGWKNVYTTADYVSPVTYSESGWNFVNVSEYLQAAMQFSSAEISNKPVPFPSTLLGKTTEKCGEISYHTGHVNFKIKMRIIKPFIGYTTFKAPLAKFYNGDNLDSGKRMGAAQTIVLMGTVIAPESCLINVTNSITIDFGKISKNAFEQAGIGGKPAGVNEKREHLAIKCDNLANSSALLTLRLTSQNANGDMLISSDPAIGFKVANVADGKILTPNDLNSKIPFQYTNPNPTNIALKFWPVSVTGLPPTLGKFKAEGYLRVDYN